MVTRCPTTTKDFATHRLRTTAFRSFLHLPLSLCHAPTVQEDTSVSTLAITRASWEGIRAVISTPLPLTLTHSASRALDADPSHPSIRNSIPLCVPGSRGPGYDSQELCYLKHRSFLTSSPQPHHGMLKASLLAWLYLTPSLDLTTLFQGDSHHAEWDPL